MDMDIRISLATAADAKHIAHLLDVFRQERGYTGQTTVPLPVNQKGPQYVLLAEVEDQPVSVASMQRCHNLVSGTTFLLLTDIYVLEGFRRHGVATAMLSEGIALGRRIGCSNFEMIAGQTDKAILSTAARIGFVKHPDLLLDLNLDA
ncbi:MAG: GNAT family N-acetyltransferase [Deltaproteobacteria bacterium]|nr:GNAT family N-acetyltransferase [Deltaproteobacteria bacterium]